jgi:hypothetical protein
MADELDPKSLAAAKKHGRLLRRRTIRNRVFAGVAALFVSVAAILGYRDLAGRPLGQAPSITRSATVPAQQVTAYPSGYGEYGEGEYEEDGEGEDSGGIIVAPTSTPTPVAAPAPVVTQQS